MKLKKCVSLLLVLSLVMTLALPLSAYAASDPENYVFDISEGDITVASGSGSTLHVTYGTVPTTTADFAATQEITITGSSSEHTVVVDIPGNTANISLRDIDIEAESSSKCAFSIDNGTVNLTLKGENTLKSASDNPGLRVAAGLTIKNDSSNSGTLTATGGFGGAGIGTGFGTGASCGDVTITGGTVTATGGEYGAGIGTGFGSSASCGDITIAGGRVTAKGGENGAGIGSGYGSAASCGDITITTGTVTATGGEYGAGIGTGFGAGVSCGEIAITGGTVTATGGNYCPGIGPGFSGVFRDSDTVTVSAAAAVIAVSAGNSPSINAADSALGVGSTAHVLMASFSDSKVSGTTTDVYLKSGPTLKASYTPDIAYQSIAFTVSAADCFR